MSRITVTHKTSFGDKVAASMRQRSNNKAMIDAAREREEAETERQNTRMMMSNLRELASDLQSIEDPVERFETIISTAMNDKSEDDVVENKLLQMISSFAIPREENVLIDFAQGIIPLLNQKKFSNVSIDKGEINSTVIQKFKDTAQRLKAVKGERAAEAKELANEIESHLSASKKKRIIKISIIAGAILLFYLIIFIIAS